MNCGSELSAEEYQLLLRVCTRINRKRFNNTRDPMEFLGAAWSGLTEAKEKFDPSRSNNFAAFAIPFIKGRILDEIRKEMPFSRTVGNYVKTYYSLLDTGMPANEAYDTITEKMTHAMKLTFVHALMSRDNDYDDPDYDPISDVPDTSLTSPIDKISDEELEAKLALVIDHSLSWEERHVVKSYWNDGQSFEQIAQFLNIPKASVSEICRGALCKMARRLSEFSLMATAIVIITSLN